MSSSSPRSNRSAELLRALLMAQGPLSGEHLASGLGITRTALWKQFQALRQKGFVIEGERGAGYRLIEMSEINAEGVMASARGAMGVSVVYLQSTSSTNDEAASLAQAGAAHGTVVIAESQTAGRGRQGRAWLSASGAGLLMSVVLRPRIEPEDAPSLTYIFSLSAARAIRRMTGADVTLKWPNDLMIDDKKLGGILMELKTEPGAVIYAIAGIGVNVGAKTLPKEIRDIATSIYMATGKRHKRGELAVAILDELSVLLDTYASEGAAPVMRDWKKLCSTLGRKVKVAGFRDTIEGVAEDIDRHGRLVVRDNAGRAHALSSGDVTLTGGR